MGNQMVRMSDRIFRSFIIWYIADTELQHLKINMNHLAQATDSYA